MTASLGLQILLPLLVAPALPTGQLVERVMCAKDRGQSYALYLPSDYEAETKWPVVFALDPAARGTVPVRAFREAAERYGYVVVGSHNSRNGPLEVGFNALSAMWKDVTDLLSIDNRQVYLVGFSGGARMAGEFSQMANSVTGLVTCGAGFPIVKKGKRFPPLYLGVAGTWDMNLLELKNIDAELSKDGKNSRLITFDGGHEWPPSSVCVEILQWLEVGAFRLGLKPLDASLVQQVFDQETERFEKLGEDGKLLLAYRTGLNLQRDLAGLCDLSQMPGRLATLRDRADFKVATKLAEKIDKAESRYLKELLSEFLKSDRFNGLSWWQSKIRSIERIAEDEADPEYQLLVKRLLEFIWRNGYEKSWFASEAGETEKAVHLARISVLVKPEASFLHYNLARSLALNGDRKEALSSLRSAVAFGHSDRARIQTDPAFVMLRNEAEFQQILNAIPDEL